jgi:hypothetical protein
MSACNSVCLVADHAVCFQPASTVSAGHNRRRSLRRTACLPDCPPKRRRFVFFLRTMMYTHVGPVGVMMTPVGPAIQKSNSNFSQASKVLVAHIGGMHKPIKRSVRPLREPSTEMTDKTVMRGKNRRNRLSGWSDRSTAIRTCRSHAQESRPANWPRYRSESCKHSKARIYGRRLQ